MYSLSIELNHLEVPTYLAANEISVSPKTVDSALTCSFTGVLSSYRTGDSVQIIVTARDEYSNLRLNDDSLFSLKVIGLHTGNEYVTSSTPQGQG